MSEFPSIQRKLPPAVVTTLVVLLLALHWWLGVSATREICSTSDELAHVAGGLSYWRFDDYRLQPENGNLPQRLAALPWLATSARLDTTGTKAWGKSNVWIIGHQLFYENGNPTDFLLLLSRAIMALTGVGLGLLIFAWSRQLWGDTGGLVSLGFYAFCPNFLANAPLANSDVTMALFLLAACGAFWRQTRRLDAKTLALSTTIFALACIAKFSFVLLLPIFALLLLVRLVSVEPLVVAFGQGHTLRTWRKKLGVYLLSAFIHGAAAGLLIWAVFGFRFSAEGPGMPVQRDFFASWSLIMPTQGFWHFFFTWTRAWHLLPDAFLQGFAFVLYAAAERGAFLNGAYSSTGWVHFFPYAFLVKTPWPQLLAYALAAGATVTVWLRSGSGINFWQRMKRDLYRVAPLAILFVVYWSFSLASHLNIGLRHILPTYPVLFIGVGLLARPSARRWLAATALALVLWNAVESARIRPHYLAYFNAFAGGPTNGWRHLVDSSLDWGQDLPGLAAWLQREAHPGENVYVSYAGSGDIFYEGIHARELAPIYNFDRPRRWFELGPGLYCIGATMLQDVYSGWRGPWSLEKERNLIALRYQLFSSPKPQTPEEINARSQIFYDLDRLRFSRLCQYLRLRKPDGIVGNSIFIYRLNAEEARIAAQGSLSELADLMARAVSARATTP